MCIALINEYGTGHTEAIVTANDAAQRFTEQIDAAAVMVASTAFTDGSLIRLRRRIGISTRNCMPGPMGLPERRPWMLWEPATPVGLTPLAGETRSC